MIARTFSLVALMFASTHGAIAQAPAATSNCAKYRFPQSLATDIELVRYIKLDRVARCRESVKRTREVNSLLGSDHQTMLAAVARLGQEADPKYLRIAESYLQECFGDQVYDVLARTAKDAVLEKLAPHVGLLRDRMTKSVKCTAAKSGRRILTARHCFEPTTVFQGSRWHYIDPDVLEFVDSRNVVWPLSRPEGTQQQYIVDEQDAWLSSDWVVLELPPEATGPVVKIAPVNPAWDRLFIPAYYGFVRGLKPEATTNPGVAVLVDLSPTCRPFAVGEGFVLHACQTMGGVSGAPIFQRVPSTGDYVLVGLHNGTAQRLGQRRWACAEVWQNSIPNYGLVATDEMSRRLNAER